MGASRQILERLDEDAEPVGAVARALREHRGVRVLDESETNLLVEGDAEELGRLAARLQGWQAVPLCRIPVPDTRPRVLRPPED